MLYAIGVLAAGQLGIVPPLVSALQRDLGLSLTSAGMTVSIVTLVGALFGLPAGGWSERVGHARALRIGILVMAGAAALCAAAGDANTLLAARGLAGVGYLLVVVACPSLMVGAAEPRHHAFALSLWGTFVPVGIALSGIVAAAFADGADWRIMFAVDAGLLAFGLIIAIIAIPRTGGPQQDRRPVSIGALRAAAPLSIAFFCFALIFLALAGLLPAWLVERRGLPADAAGRIVAVATAFGILAASWRVG